MERLGPTRRHRELLREALEHDEPGVNSPVPLRDQRVNTELAQMPERGIAAWSRR